MEIKEAIASASRERLTVGSKGGIGCVGGVGVTTRKGVFLGGKAKRVAVRRRKSSTCFRRLRTRA